MADVLDKARVAFTGKLASMTRREARVAVCAAGGEPVSSISHRTAILVVGTDGWPLLPDGTVSRKLRRAGELLEAGCPIRILPEPAFLEIIGRVPHEPLPRKTFPPEEVCRALKIGPEMLRHWEQFGLIQPSDGLYDFQDLVSIQTIRSLVGNGIRPERIARSLRQLASALPGLDRPLAQLRLVADNPEALLVDLGGKRLSAGGQLLLDFEGQRRSGGDVLPLESLGKSRADWFELGVRFEEEELYPEAAEAFRAVLSMEPDCSDAHFHLGNITREMGILWAAEEFYGTAARLAPSMVSAWCGLASVQEERGAAEEAISSYQAAIAACHDCSDAHFNLALCYEKVGRIQDAIPHWFAFLKLDPGSASSQVARRRLSVGQKP